MKTKISLLTLFFLTGCATLTPMDWHRAPPADWPTLAVNIHDVTPAEISAKCANVKYAAGATPKGCALVNFTARVCNIYVVSRDPALLAHESGHCRGFDHPGDATMRNAWERHKARGGI